MTYQTDMCVLQYREAGTGNPAEIEVYSTEEEAVNRLYEILEEDYNLRCQRLPLVHLEKWCLDHNIIVCFSFHRLEQKK